ncbi:EutN/CcmL family microcompartment protein [Micromonospora sp. NBC_01638]|uniref:EutN/CcmL family microcompartment protein n=1 Tax=Micromonospora sp. NBC_01638 TaxID=2975982 RepID=UPI003870804C|nr:EutN/CcmL family microcompartment protein [Micromonospora sp. NBC_01638]
MVVGEVVAKVWADKIIPSLQGRRLVLVRPRADGPELVAVDPLNVGIGSIVLVATDEAAAAATGEPTADAAVVALVADPATGRQ